MTSDNIVKNIFNVFKQTKSKTHFKHPSKAFHNEKKLILSEETILNRLEEEFKMSHTKLKEIVEYFLIELNNGLIGEKSTLAMLPTYITRLPTGKEVGKYLALDLGGTNFRVCEIFLECQSKIRTKQKKFSIPELAKNADGERLFDFMADSVESFLNDVGISPYEEDLDLGFTFSFPVKQKCINSAELSFWCKGFACKNTTGKDVVVMLNEAFQRKKMRVHVTALVNDTVGTLMSGAYSDPQAKIGVILGIGTNAAYIENIDNLKKWKGCIPSSGKMVLNTEWGAFDEEERKVLPMTIYDQQLDAISNNPGKHIFEKMISSLYLGEIVRLVCLSLMEKGLLFEGASTTTFLRPNCVEIQYLSRIERDYTIDLSDTKMVLQDLLDISHTTIKDRRIVRRIVELVGIRSARLAACGITAILKQMNKLDGCTVVIDGSIFEYYPNYDNKIRDAIHELLGPLSENVILSHGKDGSGVGAGIVAALAKNNSELNGIV